VRERELVAIIRGYRADALGADDGALASERAAAMDHYHGRPYGNEQEGRSAVVSRDLSETVDWAIPAIMRVFTQSGNVAEFDPVGPEDEELAQQESDAINKVVMQENNGFLLFHDVFKDALILKNGYAKHYWDVTEKVTEEEYSGLTMEALAGLLGDLEGSGAEVIIKGQESRQEFMQSPQGPVPYECFDVKLQIKRKTGRVRVEAVPCEEVRVSKRCRGALSDADFVEHVTRKTRSALIEMGMDRGFVETLPAHTYDEKSEERLARDSVTDESDDMDTAIVDKAMEEIEFCEAYLRVDWDGDGVAELRKVVTVADRVPPGAEWNEAIEEMPITGGVIKRIPHRHVGESLDDELQDLQEIKTALSRSLLDNIYFTNNVQWAVNERVNLADFMSSIPGGIKRIRGMDPIAGSYEPIQTTPILGQILPAIDYFDGVARNRTGVNESSTGMDADTLKQSTKGAFLENMNRASQKIEMITRLLAETFVKPMLLAVHGLMIRHQDKPKMMRLRGKYVQINPQEWRERTDMTLKVGLGTGNEEEKREKLMIIAQAQQQLAQLGLVGPQQGYNLFVDIAKTLGADMPEKYAINPDPQNPEWQQKQQQGPQKDPLVQAEEVKAQATLQKAQMDQQGEAQKMQMQAEIERQKLAMTQELKERELQMRAEFDRWKAQLEIEAKIKMKEMELAMRQPVMVSPMGAA